MFKQLSKKLNSKNTLPAFGFLLLLVVTVPQIAYADLLQLFLWKFIQLVFGWLVWVSGSLLDYSINNMVVGFGDMYASNGLGLTIDTMWVTVRDIFNVTFIFGLVFIGLRMIFGSDSNTKKMLVSIILAALLVNFSLFTTKFVVDFSNIAAVQLVSSFDAVNEGKPSISGSFANLMGLTSIWDYTTKAGIDFSKFKDGGAYGYIFGTMFLYIITAFVFFAGAFLLIIRFVVLNIYMVLSPFMFIGWVFPSMAKHSSEYWSGFLSRCFVAPAYILMLFFSAKVLTTFSVTGGSGRNSLSSLWSEGAPASFEQVFPPFILTAVFLIASIVVAQKMSATGGSAIISMQDKLMKKTRSAVQGTAFAMTRPARSLAKSGTAWAGGKATSKINAWQAQAHAKGSAAGAGWGAKVIGAVATSNAVDKTTREVTAAVTNAQFGTGTTQKADDEYKQKTKNRVEERARVMAGTDPINVSELARLRQQDKDFKAGAMGVTALTPAEISNLIELEKIEQEMQSAVADMAISSLEEMSADELEKIANYLTSAQKDKVMGSDKIDPGTKAKIATARFNAIKKVVGDAGDALNPVITKELTKLSIEQIETMGDAWIENNVHLFSNTQMDDLKKSKEFTETQKNGFVNDRTGWHKAAVSGTDYKGKPTNIAELYENNDPARSSRKSAEVANLGRDVLLDPITAPLFLSVSDLEVISDKKTLGAADRATLEANIRAAFPGGGPLVSYLNSPSVLRRGF